MTTKNANGSYIIDDGQGPELWRDPEDQRLVPLPVLTKERLRIAMWSDSGFVLGDAYLADVDKVWQVIADAVERGDL
jgi:hypothetical protein